MFPFPPLVLCRTPPRCPCTYHANANANADANVNAHSPSPSRKKKWILFDSENLRDDDDDPVDSSGAKSGGPLWMSPRAVSRFSLEKGPCLCGVPSEVARESAWMQVGVDVMTSSR